MNTKIENLQKNIEPLRQQIINHKVYKAINNLESLRIFMQHHVFAVWDFMSLLKSLQQNLTCTTVPWFPVGDGDTRYLVNEIVLGEESDEDASGKRKSHFELYLDAMQECGAVTTNITAFTTALQKENNLEKVFGKTNLPGNTEAFIKNTFETIGSNKNYLQSAVFTFGREDLIPSMFHSIVNDIDSKFPGNISIFKYYLERHIEVDGGHHSHLALQMTANLCGDNEMFWQEAEAAVIKSLQHRILLWDGVYDCIHQ